MGVGLGVGLAVAVAVGVGEGGGVNEGVGEGVAVAAGTGVRVAGASRVAVLPELTAVAGGVVSDRSLQAATSRSKMRIDNPIDGWFLHFMFTPVLDICDGGR